MRTLIVGTSYVQGAAAAEVFRMWADLTRKMNPGVDILVIDSNSPTPTPPVPDTQFSLIRCADNIGHLFKGGRDGWGRSFTVGLDWATDQDWDSDQVYDYDHVAFIECDLLFARPVSEVINRMAAHGVKAAAPMAFPYQFTETALMFFSVPYLREIDLIGKYDWEHPPSNGLLPEQRVQAICADAMFALPLRGFRNDMRVTADRLPAMFPQGIDWITHAELPVLRKFLEMNGHV